LYILNSTFIKDSKGCADLIIKAFIDKINAVNRGVQLQKDHETAVLNNDKLESVDSMTDLMHNYLAPRIKYGKFDMIIDDLNELKASAMENNGDGLSILKQQGIGNIDDTVESFVKRIDAVQEKAKSIQEMYEYMNLNYGWRTTPVDKFTDNYMWEQVLDSPYCKPYSLSLPGIMYFKRGDFPGEPINTRAIELAYWANRIVQTGDVEEIMQQALAGLLTERKGLKYLRDTILQQATNLVSRF
jgi:hypothetical protein